MKYFLLSSPTVSRRAVVSLSAVHQAPFEKGSTLKGLLEKTPFQKEIKTS